jgi:hypothetical protein
LLDEFNSGFLEYGSIKFVISDSAVNVDILDSTSESADRGVWEKDESPFVKMDCDFTAIECLSYVDDVRLTEVWVIYD